MKSTLKQLALLTAFLLSAHSAEAQIDASWTGTASPPDDQFSNGHNWDTGTVPTGTATISTTATVDLPATATTLTGDLIVTTSTVVVNGTTAAFTAYTLQVNNGGVLTLDIPTSGTFTIDGSGYTSFIGGLTNTSGVLNLTGPGTLYLPAGTNDFGVGQGGNGKVNQTAGFFNAGAVSVFIGGDGGVVGNSGSTSPGIGVYTLSGTSTFTASSLYIAPGSTSGTGTSSGTFNINGGIVNVTDVVMGANDSHPANPTAPIRIRPASSTRRRAASPPQGW